MPTDIALVGNNGLANDGEISRHQGVTAAITVDNGTFDDDHDFLIDIRNLETFLAQIQNTGVTNPMDFEIYGSIDPATAAPAFALTTWNLLTNGSGEIAQATNDIFTSELNLIWILIRLKEETPDSDTTALIRINSGVQ